MTHSHGSWCNDYGCRWAMYLNSKSLIRSYITLSNFKTCILTMTPSNPYLIAFILFIIVFITSFGFLFLSIYHSCSRQNTTSWRTIMLITIVFLIFCILCVILDSTRLVLCWRDNVSMLSGEYFILKAINDFFYFSISDLFNIILFLRLHLVFRESVYALNVCTITIFIFQMLLSISVNIINTCLIIFDKDKNPSITIYIVFIVIIINDLIISMTIIILFVYKLHKLMRLRPNKRSIIAQRKGSLNKSDSVTKCTSSNASYHTFKLQSVHASNSTQLDQVSPKSHIDFLIVMTRDSILYTFAICSNQIYYDLVLLQYIYASFTGYYLWRNILLGIVMYGGRVLGVLGIASCIMLGMQFGKKGYFKLCWCCHLLCIKCFHKCTQPNI